MEYKIVYLGNDEFNVNFIGGFGECFDSIALFRYLYTTDYGTLGKICRDLGRFKNLPKLTTFLIYTLVIHHDNIKLRWLNYYDSFEYISLGFRLDDVTIVQLKIPTNNDYAFYDITDGADIQISNLKIHINNILNIFSGVNYVRGS